MRIDEQPDDLRPENSVAVDDYAPRKMTAADNVVLTIKLLLGFTLVGAAIWAIEAWRAVK